MNYIVLDLEFNQAFPLQIREGGAEPGMSFEII